MKRYKAINFEYDDAYGAGTALDIVEHDEGEFVKYDDIKHLLQNTPSNSDYGKLPTINSIVDELNGGKNLGWTPEDVEPIVNVIKSIGNFE